MPPYVPPWYIPTLYTLGIPLSHPVLAAEYTPRAEVCGEEALGSTLRIV